MTKNFFTYKEEKWKGTLRKKDWTQDKHLYLEGRHLQGNSKRNSSRVKDYMTVHLSVNYSFV